MDIYLIRHPKVKVDLGICYGQSDLALAKDSERAIKKLKREFQSVNVERCFTSPLKRCASIANSLFNKKIIKIDERLMELHFGQWELKKWNDIDRLIFNAWARQFVAKRCPGGESYQDLYRRVIQFWQHQITPAKYQSVVMITHGGVIRAILAYLFKIPLKNTFSIDIMHAGLSHIKWTGKTAQLSYLNY